MSKKLNSEPLGKLYNGKKTIKRREWRGLRDTLYDYKCWLGIMAYLVKFLTNPQNLKGMFRYRWMINNLATLDFLDRHTAGARGPQLRMAHLEYDFIIKHMADNMAAQFKRDQNIGGSKKLSDKTVIFDENMMSQVMNGFPNLKAISREIPPIFTGSTMRQDSEIFYIDVSEQYGIPGDVCPMPAAELGVAVQDDYPEFGCCILIANSPCDTSLMGNGIEQRHFAIPTHQVAVPINYTDPNVNDYSAQEIKDAIKFVEDQTGEKFDWDYYFKCMKIFNQETRNFLEWLEVNKTDYPQVVGNNIAPFRYAYYMVAGGREIGFLDAEKKINKLMYKAYENKVPVVSEVRHRAIVWGVQAQYYSHFPAWLQNCWGIIPLVDMLSLTSTKIYSEDDKEQAYYDMADLYANMVMRNRSEGGYQVGVEDLWRFCEEFRADVVIMYEHIGCKAVTGYHGLYEEQARKHNVHLIWVTHGLMDPRDASRQSMRNDVNRYMRTVFHEEPLDPSLEEFDDSNAY